MVRRQREQSTSEDDIVIDSSPPKKHKRHKHKKHKKRRIENEFDSDTSIDVSYEDVLDKTYKMKVKTGRDVAGSSAADLLKAQTMKSSSDSRRSMPGSSSSTPPKASKKKKKGRDSGTSSEEERWLDAIKSGKLEEVDDELKKIKPKDPKMMTARQRAMYERGTDKEAGLSEVLLALPSGYKEKVMTAEALQKAALKSQKRKQLADEKREKDKKKTMDRLLKKQESKNLKNMQKCKPTRKHEPMIVYKINNNEITLSLPPGIPFPLEAQPPKEAPKPTLCGVSGCENIKKYNCSKTGIALCSLECYKKNLNNISMQ
ncbi:INO80 complex subunit B [Amyelois transitella]|uniref:INO80 complex subunit B n=1 Tax=Amyelois transitella TaxID=680683 RepID=UPI00067D4D31|nr:INO80 complex subunit B [Amyelois transitella]